jgi:hypothetical protein
VLGRGWKDVMVFWGSGQIDEDGLKLKELTERAFSELGRPAADFLTIVQGCVASIPIRLSRCGRRTDFERCASRGCCSTSAQRSGL